MCVCVCFCIRIPRAVITSYSCELNPAQLVKQVLQLSTSYVTIFIDIIDRWCLSNKPVVNAC